MSEARTFTVSEARKFTSGAERVSETPVMVSESERSANIHVGREEVEP
jgi:hypothetical protein